MKSLYKGYKADAIFLIVYIREAHPEKDGQAAANARFKVGDTVFNQPKTFKERRKLAELACDTWKMTIPTLVDTMTPSSGQTYEAWPNRIYVIDKEGKIVQRGPKGPRGVTPRAGEKALRDLLGKPQKDYVTPEDAGSGRRRPTRR